MAARAMLTTAQLGARHRHTVGAEPGAHHLLESAAFRFVEPGGHKCGRCHPGPPGDEGARGVEVNSCGLRPGRDNTELGLDLIRVSFKRGFARTRCLNEWHSTGAGLRAVARPETRTHGHRLAGCAAEERFDIVMA